MASGEAVQTTLEADTECAGARPYPERKVRNREEEKTRRKKHTGPAEHNFIESADYRNPRGRARKKRSTRYRQSNCRNYLLDAQLEAEAQALFRPFRKPHQDQICRQQFRFGRLRVTRTLSAICRSPSSP